MPVLHNLWGEPLQLKIGVEIPANGSLEVSDEQAAVVAGHPLLSVEPDPEPAPQPSPEAPAEPAPAEPTVSDDVAKAEAELAQAQADLDAAKAKEIA